MGSPREADIKAAEDRKKEGKDAKTTIKDGKPAVNLDDRSCTDILVCLLFVAMIVVMVGITGFAFGNGDIERIATKYDMDGKKCEGDYPFKLFTRLMPAHKYNENGITRVQTGAQEQYLDWSVCIDKCPNKNSQNLKFLPNKQYPAGTAVLSSWDSDTDILMGFCFPDKKEIEKVLDMVTKSMNTQIGGFSKYMVDIQESWKLILLMAFASMVITLIYMFLLKWITKPLLYVSLFLILIFGGLITAWCVQKMQTYPKESDDYKYSMAGAIVAAIITLLYVIFLCCNWKNIAIGADIMAAAGDFVSTCPRIALVPILCYIICLPVVAWYAATNVYLYSTGEPKFIAGQMFAQLDESKEAHTMFWIFMFGFFWIVAFIIAILQFTIAATCALWYFNAGSDAEGVDVSTGLWWAFRYHLGSLAFGSLLIAIVTMLKVVFEYFAKKYEKLAGDNPFVKAIICYVRCMIWCLDKCVKFISENAYIQVAINGSSFCGGAKDAFFMIIGNPGTFAAMQIVGWIMTAIGKGVVVGVSTYITMLLADQNVLVTTEGAKIQQPFVPSFIVLLVAYLVASFFISIFDFACLTILQCFIKCKEAVAAGHGKIDPPASLRPYLIKSGEKYGEDGKDDKKPNQVD